MKLSGYLVGLALLANASAAQAEGQFDQRRKTVDGNCETRIYNVFNCRTGITNGVNATAEHGSVSTRLGKQPRCGLTEQDVMEVHYRPNPGYRGPDDVHVYWGRRGHSVVYLNVR